MTPAIYVTKRELDIWKLVALGIGLKETCERLKLKRHTVVQYRKTLYQAIHVEDAVGATHAAVAHGIVKIAPASTTLVVSQQRKKDYP